MSNNVVQIIRNKIGVEDLLLGEGQEEQNRDGKDIQITKINAGNFPYSDAMTLKQFVENLQIHLGGEHNLVKLVDKDYILIQDSVSGVFWIRRLIDAHEAVKQDNNVFWNDITTAWNARKNLVYAILNKSRRT